MDEQRALFEETREVPVRLANQRLTADQSRIASSLAQQKSRHSGVRGRDLPSYRYRHVFLEEAGRLLEDDCFGLHLAQETDPREFGAIYYVSASSDTALDAVVNLMRFVRVVNAVEAFTLHKSGHQIVLEGRSITGIEGFGRHMFEYGDAVFLCVLRELTGKRIKPTLLEFDHERTTSKEELVAFFGCPIKFGCPVHRVVFERNELEAPLLTADSHLNQMVRGFLETALGKREYASTPMRARVEKIVSKLLPNGKASVENVAREMSMSTRTIARRLADEGLTYTTLVDELRRDIALRYLENPELELTEIAWLLGYTEVSSFNHAFRRWQGRSPTAYRKKKNGD